MKDNNSDTNWEKLLLKVKTLRGKSVSPDSYSSILEVLVNLWRRELQDLDKFNATLRDDLVPDFETHPAGEERR